MDIYPTHRDFRDNATREERTAYNARHAELYNGDDGINGYNGGLPFPIRNWERNRSGIRA